MGQEPQAWPPLAQMPEVQGRGQPKRRGGRFSWDRFCHTPTPIKNPFPRVRRARKGLSRQRWQGMPDPRIAVPVRLVYHDFDCWRNRTALRSPSFVASAPLLSFQALKQPSGSAQEIHAEQWPSGRRRTPGKCVYVKSVSWVRIPPAPPIIIDLIALFCIWWHRYHKRSPIRLALAPPSRPFSLKRLSLRVARVR